jgi:hypothetical protein
MDAKALKLYCDRQAGGVIIRMIDGTEYRIPHRDYVWFTPGFGEAEKRAGRSGTSFWIADTNTEEYRIVNALLVKEVVALPPGRASKKRKRSA